MEINASTANQAAVNVARLPGGEAAGSNLTLWIAIGVAILAGAILVAIIARSKKS